MTQTDAGSLHRYLLWALCSTLPGCVGTEADNPLTDGSTNPAQATPCKGDGEYEPFALAELRGPGNPKREPGWRLAATPAPMDPAMAFTEAGRGLTPLNQFPVVTECADWAEVDDELAVQFVNFSAGCGITWSAEARVVEPGVVALELTNATCDVAACESCEYDARGRIPLEAIQAQTTLTVRLALYDCNGLTHTSEWVIDAADAAHGNRCKQDASGPFGGPYTTDYQRNLYENCDPNDMSYELASADHVCDATLTCSAGRCLPPCASSEECPLDGAFECVEGLCQLRQ